MMTSADRDGGGVAVLHALGDMTTVIMREVPPADRFCLDCYSHSRLRFLHLYYCHA